MSDEGLTEGLYETLLTDRLARRIRTLDPSFRSDVGDLDPAEAPAVLARLLFAALDRALHAVPRNEDQVVSCVEACNRLLDALHEALPTAAPAPDRVAEPRVLLSVTRQESPALGPGSSPPRPGVPLSENALLVNARGEHRIGSEVEREMASADAVDLLCSFLKWSGYRVLEEAIQRHLRLRRRLRVLTTCYLGATERRVLDRLVSSGAEVKVSYETSRTRLHAKAWLFHRTTGFSTAYVGSSNLSSAALHDGLEWNLRISAVESPRVLDRIRDTFESYWQTSEFEPYDPARDAARFDDAVRRERGETTGVFVEIDVRPWPFQAEILERLLVERLEHDRWKNLVVAATGTGKTVMAALDYQRMRDRLGTGRLLFVAHRKEILQQSRATFRTVLRDSSFGEPFVAGERPLDNRHVFASVQSLANVDLAGLAPDAFDVVIFDEIHHAAAPTYERLLAHVKPKLLLGLTATPERADGMSILPWFDDRIAAELRLWEALDRGVLCPFQYFGVADGTDLTTVTWRRGRYDAAELEGIYTADQARADLVVNAVREKVADPARMRAIGFCVGVSHARFMAEQFRRRGIPSVAVSGDSSDADRDASLRDLKARRVNAVFAVDLFNEGIDVPEIDTVLFLRPTESATVFLQQLGRGLRKSPEKSCLTVLDFIAKHSRKFRFDLRYRALTGLARSQLPEQVREGFSVLPSGCSVQLDAVSREAVLANLREALRASTRNLVDELRSLGDVGLQRFLSETGVDLEDLYDGRRTWTTLRRAAGFAVGAAGPDEESLQSALPRLLHLDDPRRLRFLDDVLSRGEPPTPATLAPREMRALEMLHATLWGINERATLVGSLARLWRNAAVREEMVELSRLLLDRVDHLTAGDVAGADVPIAVHGRYSLAEVLAAYGASTAESPRHVREGVFFDREHATDLLFVTLQKAEKDYSPSTMYRDYALSSELFHWQSQNTTSEDSPTGRRYRTHRVQGSHVVLFVRSFAKGRRGSTVPYTCLGEVEYLSHSGERPMSITWKLRHPMPATFLSETALQVG